MSKHIRRVLGSFYPLEGMRNCAHVDLLLHIPPSCTATYSRTHVHNITQEAVSTLPGVREYLRDRPRCGVGSIGRTGSFAHSLSREAIGAASLCTAQPATLERETVDEPEDMISEPGVFADDYVIVEKSTMREQEAGHMASGSEKSSVSSLLLAAGAVAAGTGLAALAYKAYQKVMKKN